MSARPRPYSLIQGALVILAAGLGCILETNQIAHARQFHRLQASGVAVFYDAGLKSAGEEVATRFPAIRRRLEAAFELKMRRTPQFLLIRKHEDFLRMSPNSLAIAFASPSEDLIVIDQSRMRTDPFTMQSTLTHEACHILLHQHITAERLPRWLDEGLCQWISNSVNEMLRYPKNASRLGAIIARQANPLAHLEHRFPSDNEGRMLAYEASKRFAAFIIRKFGRDRLSILLKHLAQDEDARTATANTYGLTIDEIQRQWQRSMARGPAWVTFLSHYLYEILFSAMACITVVGFVRSRLKKRNYRDEDDNEDMPDVLQR